MASYIQGYDEERFVTTVNRNFICLICFNVLKDPVLCPKNQHCFCRGCITKYLENAKRCPTCADDLTVDILTEPNRMVKDILNELNIRCIYIDRGCQEILQLQHLDSHEDTCGFTPAVCTNLGCGATVNQRDLIHHESEVCEFRKLKCHSCEETKKTLADVEKRMANVETKVTTVEGNVVKIKQNMAALIEGFNELKDVLLEIKQENTKILRNRPSGDRENIIVAGGSGVDSVEMFNWRTKTWSPLQSMPQKRYGATSFVYNNHVTIAGGWCHPGYVDDMIRMNAEPKPDLSIHWSNCPVKLPTKLANHSHVLYNNQLIVTGGYNGNAISDNIHEVQLVPPYNAKLLSKMPEPRQYHCTEISEDSVFIIGGRKTRNNKDNLSSVVLYDLKKNECKQLAPLPYEVSKMATVKWGENIVVIGGIDKGGQAINTVIIYNIETGQSNMLPAMRFKREGCAAVVIGNTIVVLGGWGEEGPLKSVEAFNFESYSWVELPEMFEKRRLHSALVA